MKTVASYAARNTLFSHLALGNLLAVANGKLLKWTERIKTLLNVTRPQRDRGLKYQIRNME
jgi:hypothetical protein